MISSFDRLPYPSIDARHFGARRVPVLTDDNLYKLTGVRIAFTGRDGGISEGPFFSLNLGDHVDDSLEAVQQNRRLLLEALDAKDASLIVPRQIHGDRIVSIKDSSPDALCSARSRAQEGADALAVFVSDVAALLCFADCVPVIIVSPTGCFAVAHAGWRGVMNGVAMRAVAALAAHDKKNEEEDLVSEYNVYIGPHIHGECFETGSDVHAQFVERFGPACAPDSSHVSLLAALSASLIGVGVDPVRIVDAGKCTMCMPDQYFSYRVADGVCGRHGAIALRKA